MSWILGLDVGICDELCVACAGQASPPNSCCACGLNCVENNAQQVVWVHDEIQVECDAKDADAIGKIAVDCIKRAGEHYKLRVPLTGEYKVSTDWSGTH